MTDMKEIFEYGKAVARLEEIVSELERNDGDIDSLVDKLKEARKLLKLCREKLYKVDKSIKSLQKNDSSAD